MKFTTTAIAAIALLGIFLPVVQGGIAILPGQVGTNKPVQGTNGQGTNGQGGTNKPGQGTNGQGTKTPKKGKCGKGGCN